MANRLKQLELETPDTPLFERVFNFGSFDKENYHQQSTVATASSNSGNVCLNFIRRSSLGMLPSPKTHPIRELKRQFSHETQSDYLKQSVGGFSGVGNRFWSLKSEFGGYGQSTATGVPPPSSSSSTAVGHAGRRHMLPQLKVQLSEYRTPTPPIVGQRKMPDVPVRITPPVMPRRTTGSMAPDHGTMSGGQTATSIIAATAPTSTASTKAINVPITRQDSVTSGQSHSTTPSASGRKLPQRQRSRELPSIEDVMLQKSQTGDTGANVFSLINPYTVGFDCKYLNPKKILLGFFQN